MYRPRRGFHGVVAFRYRVRDAHGGGSGPLTVTIRVLAPTVM